MKKHLSILLVLLIVISCVFAFNSCNAGGKQNDKITNDGYVNQDLHTEPTEDLDNALDNQQGNRPEKEPSKIPENIPDGDLNTGGMNEPCAHIFDRVDYMNLEYYCSKCGIRKDMLYRCDHDFTEYQKAEGGTVNCCFYCAQGKGKTEADCSESHAFTTVVEPTFYDVGLESAECGACGYAEVRILQPLNTGSYVCTFTLQQYADGAAEELGILAKDIYEECIADGTTELYAYPYGDLATYKEIRAFVQELVKDEATEYGKARKIYDWVLQNITYSQNAELYDVGQVWESKQAVCSQYVQLMHDMLSAADIMSSYTAGYSSYVPWDQNTSVSLPTIYQHTYDTGHAIVTCYVDGRVLYMDPTWGDSLGADEYFDMSNEKLTSYFIPVEINLIKVIPDGIDVRNYDAHLHRIGDHIIDMAYGNALESLSVVYGINNLRFEYAFAVAENTNESYYLGEKQYIGSAFRACYIHNANGLFWFFLPDGSRQDYGEVYEYVALLNGEYGKSIELPMYDMFEFYGDCLYRKVSGGYELVSCKSEKQEITVPGSINGLPVLFIGASAFQENTSIKKLVIGEGVIEINQSALSWIELEELYLPATLEYFYGAYETPIHTLVVSEQNQYFKTVDNVLYSKNGEALIYYPSGKTDKSYSVKEGTRVIKMMSRNPYVEAITLPDSLEKIGDMWGLYNLSEMELPSGLTDIIQICATKLTELIVPDGVTYLGGCAFAENAELKRIVLPKNLDYAAEDILVNCVALETIEISSESEKWKTVDGVLFDKDMKKLHIYPLSKTDSVYAIPEGVTQLPSFAFATHEYLRELILPQSLKVVSMAAFNTTHIEKINLDYVEEFSGGTFSGCDRIDVIVLSSNVKKLGAQEFFKCNLSLVIENPELITDAETFMRAEGVSVFLDYDEIGEKELHWASYVKGVYTRSQWEYVDGVPTLKNS